MAAACGSAEFLPCLEKVALVLGIETTISIFSKGAFASRLLSLTPHLLELVAHCNVFGIKGDKIVKMLGKSPLIIKLEGVKNKYLAARDKRSIMKLLQKMTSSNYKTQQEIAEKLSVNVLENGR